MALAEMKKCQQHDKVSRSQHLQIDSELTAKALPQITRIETTSFQLISLFVYLALILFDWIGLDWIGWDWIFFQRLQRETRPAFSFYVSMLNMVRRARTHISSLLTRQSSMKKV